jgi:hypothetical protein
MQLVGLHGMCPQVGKDTAYQAMQEWSFGRGVLSMKRGFANALKVSMLVSLGAAKIPTTEEELQAALDLADEIKQRGMIEIWLQASESDYDRERICETSGRDALRWYGTEGHRSIFADDIWVDKLLPKTVKSQFFPSWHDSFRNLDTGELPQLAVITDVRFPNEFERIHQLGGKVGCIRWPEREQKFLDEMDRQGKEIHVSDLLHEELCDFTIINGDSVGAFQGRVRSHMSNNYNEEFPA